MTLCCRDLKDCYFTVLGVYDLSELKRQREALQSLLDTSLLLASQTKPNKDKLRYLDPVEVSVSVKDTSSKSSGGGKNRRNTLRKQIERIDVLLSDGVDRVEDNNNTHTTDSNQPEAANDIPGLINPKSRGGWGFWQS